MPTLYRYSAIAVEGGAQRSGERAGESAAEVRASLRRIGLRVIDIRPTRQIGSAATEHKLLASVPSAYGVVQRRLRSRRGERKAELLDATATMLETGLPLVEALRAVASASGEADRATRRIGTMLAESVAAGQALSEAMRSDASWFDDAECAMVAAGERRGELAAVLRSLCDREHRRGELGGKLAAALTYPAIVGMVGVGVAVFLSVKTLPDLTTVLTDAGIEIPQLTAVVMACGQFAARWGMLTLVGLFLVGAGALAIARQRCPGELDRLTPRVARRAVLAEVLLGLAELIRTGVPLVDAIRVIGPATRGLGAGTLRRRLDGAAARIEGGEAFSETLDDQRWFGEQLRRQLAVSEQTGDLQEVLKRLGDRYQRSARRLIDRLARLLEPAAIIMLALFVGTVVMAAILPLLRLQEVVR